MRDSGRLTGFRNVVQTVREDAYPRVIAGLVPAILIGKPPAAMHPG
jgi:hypothetical protein